jgi:hypothetical protein
MENQETIKEVTTKRYQVRLVQDSDSFYVMYDSKTQALPVISEAIKDYNVASGLFDMKLVELEGN